VDTPQDARAARVALRRSLGKDTDGPVSRLLNRPLSTRLSMVLAPLRPAPDLVSLVAFTLGLAGAVLLAAGQGLAGGLLVHASSVADGVDGRWPGCSFGAGRGGGRWMGCWTGWRTRPSWLVLDCGRWRGMPPGGAGVDGGRDHWGAVVDGVQGPGGRLGVTTGSRAGAGVLLGGRDGRLLLVAVGAVLGAPVAALAATTATSALSLGLRVGFVRRPSAHNVG
jgi:1L-myo-inositol 1-phosphate cytidylyltransferase / CDP-L-myo-inositol myo-inositolphosphotransferase